MNTNSIFMWETLANNADWDCFKTPILQEILKTQNQHQEVSCVFFGSHTFGANQLDGVKKQTSVFAQFYGS